MKKIIAWVAMVVMLIPQGVIQEAKAASALDVVINEVAWAGSLDASNDEFIELYNNTGLDIDLTGWQLLDDGTPTDLSGIIPANSYFLIENHEDAVATLDADLLISLSLANSGDTLELVDDLGNTIDTVNASGGAWAAGDNTSKASMERIDSTLNDWSNCTLGNGNQASGGSDILGTPGALNSVSEAPSGTGVTLTPSASDLQAGETLTVTATVSSVTDLFSYGFDLDYDPTVLDYQSAAAGGFLTDSSFNAELENGTEGTLVVGEARTITPQEGISGDGVLFTAEFLVIGAAGSNTSVSFSNSFLSDPDADIDANFTGTSVSVDANAENVNNLIVQEGGNRYEINLLWDAAAGGADSYRILRLNPAGDFEELGTATGTTFTDSNDITPNVTYTYQVVTVLGISESSGTQAMGQDTRGLTGDNNRSDRVDGRDLDNLAKHYSETSTDPNYDQLVDTTYDGNINGSDLIDIGINWALTYTE